MKAAEFKALFGGKPNFTGGITPTEKKPQIRLPKPVEPNKTEAAFIEYAKRAYPDGSKVLYEPFTLRLPSGARYTPDVIVVTPDGKIDCWEVKGAHIHNQRSIHAFKEAAAAFNFFGWGFAQKQKSEWSIARY